MIRLRDLDLQPTYTGDIIHLQSTMDIPWRFLVIKIPHQYLWPLDFANKQHLVEPVLLVTYLMQEKTQFLLAICQTFFSVLQNPLGSMYGSFTYIWGFHGGKYTIVHTSPYQSHQVFKKSTPFHFDCMKSDRGNSCWVRGWLLMVQKSSDHQLRLADFSPLFSGVSYIPPGGCLGFLNHQWCEIDHYVRSNRIHMQLVIKYAKLHQTVICQITSHFSQFDLFG